MVSDEFEALIKEAQFTKEMLGAGATQIRNANYATKGIYFQAFISLSTGIERIGKLCLMLDHALDHNGAYPDHNYMREKIGHRITIIYRECIAVLNRRAIQMSFLKTLDGEIHQAILKVLSEFAMGDRYCNINLLVGKKIQNDPVEVWFKQVDQPLFDACVSNKKKQSIRGNAQMISALLSPHATVRHTSETGSEITDLEEASFRTGMWKAIAPYRQLYVLQVIRFWVELLYELQDLARKDGGLTVPHFGEIFAPFYNQDSYIRTRKTWDRF